MVSFVNADSSQPVGLFSSKAVGGGKKRNNHNYVKTIVPKTIVPKTIVPKTIVPKTIVPKTIVQKTLMQKRRGILKKLNKTIKKGYKKKKVRFS